jgi:two-component system, NtrC family, sensor histidine kinase HydH
MNRKILFQVTAPAILVGLLLAGTCLVSAWYIQRLQRKLSRILSQNVASLEAALELENKVRQLRFHSLLYLARPTAPARDLIRQDEHNFEEALEKARQAANTPQETEYVEKIARGYEQYRGEMAKLRQQVKLHGPVKDLHLLTAINPIQHVVQPCEDLYYSSQEQLKVSSRDTERASSQAQLALLFLGLGGPLGGGLIGYGIVRGLTRTIARLSVRVQDVVHRLDGPLGPAPGPDGNGAGGKVIDVAQVTVSPGDDLGGLDRQMQHVVRRVEEVTERLQRHHWEMLRAEQLAAVGQLAAGVAHEVRNPLTGMKLLVEAALRPGNRKPLSEEDLEVIHGEIARLEETVGNFLAFARLPAPQRQVCDLREALARPLDLVRARARQQQVRLTVETPGQALPVSLDGGQFSTVLVNLLLNALDAMPRGGELRVGLEADARECRLRVRDTGPGIAPEIAGRLFTPFASTKPTGTGLGLSLSRRIVEEHGGTVTATNQPEGGACFTITLPRSAEG